jgi:hypothetical protein
MDLIVTQTGPTSYQVVGLDPKEPDGCQVEIPIEAIADRRERYKLDSDQAALEAIMREHYERLNPASVPEPAPLMAVPEQFTMTVDPAIAAPGMAQFLIKPQEL